MLSSPSLRPHFTTCPDLQPHPPMLEMDLADLRLVILEHDYSDYSLLAPCHRRSKLHLQTLCFSYFSALVSCQFMAHEWNCGGPNSRLTAYYAYCMFQQLLVLVCSVSKVFFQAFPKHTKLIEQIKLDRQDEPIC